MKNLIIEKEKNMSTENLPALLPSQAEFNMFQTIAKNAQLSGLYGGVGGEAKIFMVLLAARELGISPLLALNGGIWNIQGKIEISARLMNAMIRRGGHTMQITSTPQECIIKAKRADTGEEHTEKFTWAMAEKAGLTKGNVWQKYPEDMLYNRCMSRLARRLFPDVIGTAYIEGEVREAISPDKLPESQYEEISSKVDPIVQPESSDCITSEQLAELMSLGEQIDTTCRDNMMKYLLDNFSITEDKLNTMPEKAFVACRAGMLNNIKMNQQKAG